jgi:polyisoprenoid-binding protein YceI
MTTQEISTTRTVNSRLVPPAGTFEVDPVHTFVTFRALHLVVGRVQGRFEGVSGSITVGEDFLDSHTEISISADSITTLMPIRDDDLRSNNYLDVAKFPYLTFKSTGVTELPSGEWILSGDLTIKDVTRPVELLVTFGGAIPDPFGNLRVGFHATTTISRRDYGLTTLLEGNDGHVLVARDVSIEIDVEAVHPL